MSIARLMQQAAAGVPAGGGDVWTDPDLANASYDSVSFVPTSQDTLPFAMRFNADGTKIFIVGNQNDSVYEYDLSTAFDISTAAYNSVSLSVTSQDTTPVGLFFKPDGTKMYINGLTNDNIFQYSLSTAFDLSTASYDSVSFSVAAQDGVPYTSFIKPDGTKLFVMGLSNDTVFQYSLSTPWDISSASYDSVSFSVTSQASVPIGLFFNPDGNKMWISDITTDTVYQYSLSTAWDVSSASYDSISFDASSQASNATSIEFKPDGSKMYITDNSGGTIYQYSTVTPAAPSWTDPDLANASYDSVSFSVAGQETSPHGIFFKPDGSKVYICGTSSDAINEYDLSTAWDVSSCSFLQSFSVLSQEGFVTDLFFKPDGAKLYIIGSTSDTINEYSLSTAWDVSTASYAQNFSIASQETVAQGLFFSDNGLKMFIVGAGNDTVYQYSLSSAWDISSASYDSKSFSVATQETNPNALFFSPSLDTMFIVGSVSDSVHEYSLSTSGDVSTASYVQSFSVSSQENNPRGISFKDDGSKMYIVGLGSDTIYQYSTT